MSPFIIFVIVLTIAYVLYYATIITMDLNAKSKKEGEHEETISASDTKEVEEENAPQTVLVVTGGFSRCQWLLPDCSPSSCVQIWLTR